ncbi:MAG: response regulator transcription factor [Candidatus Xenobia bacterium]
MTNAPPLSYGRVLVVDDEPDILRLVRHSLEREGYQVETADNAAHARDLMDKTRPDLVVLDVMLPEMDGLTFCQELRRSQTLPILMLSARGDDLDKILGLEVGADDYLTKPFNPKELIARVRALLRRSRIYTPEKTEDPDVISYHTLRIFPDQQRVELQGQPVKLTPIEYSLLRSLVTNAGKVLSRQTLLNMVWGQDFFGDERTVDAHIRNLRLKLQAIVPDNQYITSVWRVGYKFEM